MRALLLLLMLFSSAALAAEPFDTFVVIVGIETYEHQQDLPVLTGAEADCRALESKLTSLGTKALAFCGPEAGRERFIAATEDFFQEMRSGDKLVFVWTGHGIRDENDEAYFLPASAYHPMLANGDDRLHPENILLNVERFAPGTETYFFLEANHKGRLNGESLIGPYAMDFEKTSAVGVSGKNNPEQPKMAKLFTACWDPGTASEGSMTFGQLTRCIEARGLPLMETDSLPAHAQDVLWLNVPSELPRERNKTAVKVPVLATGATIAAAAATGATISFVQGFAIANRVNSADPREFYDSFEEESADRSRYGTLRVLHYASIGGMLIGGGVCAASFTASPRGASVRIRF